MVRQLDPLSDRPQLEVDAYPDCEQAVGYARGERRPRIYDHRTAQGIYFNGVLGYRQHSAVIYA